MTPEEIVCTFMEERPADGHGDRVENADARWWSYCYELRDKPDGRGREFWWWWSANCDRLDRIYEVEERLTEEQRLSYWLELSKGGSPETGYWRLVHASVDRKITALATVLALRPDATERDSVRSEGEPLDSAGGIKDL